MNFLLLNDIHLSHKAPQSRTDDWEAAIFAKLDQVAKTAVLQRVKAVCIAGDLFHHKTKIAYGTVAHLCEWVSALRAHGIDVLIIPGNHDEVHDRLDSIDAQPLGVLIAAGLVTDVSYRPVTYTDPPAEAVTVLGVPYPDALRLENFQKAAALRPPGGRAILMAHCFATSTGGLFFNVPVHRYSDLVDLPFDVFHFGHDHSDHGVMRTEGKEQFFVNIGALTRGSIAKDEVARLPKIALVTFGSQVLVTELGLRVRPPTEVFDLALKEAKDRESREVEAFVSKLSDDLTLAGPVSFKERLAGMGLPDVVRQRVQAYLDGAEVGRWG